MNWYYTAEGDGKIGGEVVSGRVAAQWPEFGMFILAYQYYEESGR